MLVAGKFPNANLRAMKGQELLLLTALAARLRQRAKDLSSTPAALLKGSGLSEKAIRDIEAGHSPTLRTLLLLTRAFRYHNVGELLGENHAAQPAGCSPQVLHIALEMVAGAMAASNRTDPLRTEPQNVAALASIAYDMVLAELARDENALSNRAALFRIQSMLSVELAKPDDPNS